MNTQMFFDLIQSIGIIISLILAIIAVKESAKSRSGVILLEVDRLMHDLRPEWHKLYKLDDDFNKWSKEDTELADKIGIEFERIASLSLHGLINEIYIMDSYQGVFMKCFDKLKGYIEKYRTERNEPAKLKDGGLQRMHFEKFVNKCWRRNKRQGNRIKIF